MFRTDFYYAEKFSSPFSGDRLTSVIAQKPVDFRVVFNGEEITHGKRVVGGKAQVQILAKVNDILEVFSTLSPASPVKVDI